MMVFLVPSVISGLLCEESGSPETRLAPVSVLVVEVEKVVCCPLESVAVITVTSVTTEVYDDSVLLGALVVVVDGAAVVLGELPPPVLVAVDVGSVAEVTSEVGVVSAVVVC